MYPVEHNSIIIPDYNSLTVTYGPSYRFFTGELPTRMRSDFFNQIASIIHQEYLTTTLIQHIYKHICPELKPFIYETFFLYSTSLSKFFILSSKTDMLK